MVGAQATTMGYAVKNSFSTLKGFFRSRKYESGRNPFRVKCTIMFVNPGFSLRSNPGLELANAFGVNSGFSETRRR